MSETRPLLSRDRSDPIGAPTITANATAFALDVRASSIHRFGVFTCEKIAANTRIIEYTGERITKAESLVRCERGNHFIFGLDEQWDLDGDVPTNPARFLNHRCDPNCEAEFDGERIWIIARRDISAGEELTFNYGYDLQDYREHPCRCGARECVGFIVAEEFFEDIRARH